MFEFRPISRHSIPRALEKADRYRLLNEPRQAESICRDILAIDPGNQEASVILLLSLTDQFPMRNAVTARDANEVRAHLTSDYEQCYYGGVIAERWGKHLLDKGYAREEILRCMKEAMQLYDHADELAAHDNDDPILRWNTCARIIETEQLAAATESASQREVEHFDDEVPTR